MLLSAYIYTLGRFQILVEILVEMKLTFEHSNVENFDRDLEPLFGLEDIKGGIVIFGAHFNFITIAFGCSVAP